MWYQSGVGWGVKGEVGRVFQGGGSGFRAGLFVQNVASVVVFSCFLRFQLPNNNNVRVEPRPPRAPSWLFIRWGIVSTPPALILCAVGLAQRSKVRTNKLNPHPKFEKRWKHNHLDMNPKFCFSSEKKWSRRLVDRELAVSVSQKLTRHFVTQCRNEKKQRTQQKCQRSGWKKDMRRQSLTSASACVWVCVCVEREETKITPKRRESVHVNITLPLSEITT